MKIITRLIRAIKGKPPNAIEKAIKENKNIEHSFIKYPKEEIQETTKNATKYSVSHSPKIIEEYRKRLKEKINNYHPKREKYIHTHSELAIPSYLDVMSLIGSSIRNEPDYSHIYIHNKKGKIIGRTTATIDYKILLKNEIFLKDLAEVMIKVKKEEFKYVQQEVIDSLFNKYALQFKTKMKKEKKTANILDFYNWLGIKVRVSPAKGYKFNPQENSLQKI